MMLVSDRSTLLRLLDDLEEEHKCTPSADMRTYGGYGYKSIRWFRRQRQIASLKRAIGEIYASSRQTTKNPPGGPTL